MTAQREQLPPQTATTQAAPTGTDWRAMLDAIIEREEKAGRIAEEAMVDRLSRTEQGADALRRRAEFLEVVRNDAIKRTRPEDWVLSKDKQGNEIAMLTASGAALVAEVYGVEVTRIYPTAAGVFRPEEEILPNGATKFTAYCDAYAAVNGRRVISLPASRRTDEDFVGRMLDAEGNFSKGSDTSVTANRGDIIKAVHTLLHTSAVRSLCGMTRVPISDLQTAWKGTSKTIERCRKGHGYGSSAARAASDLTGDEMKAKQTELRNEILRRVGGDTAAARKVLVDITENPPRFSGFKEVEKMTFAWQIDNAMTALKAHKVFGDAVQGKPQEKPAEAKKTREPGEDG